MNDIYRKEWLESLKEGDKVCNSDYNSWSREKSYQFYTVKKVTSKGRIRLNNDILLDENGCGFAGERYNRDYYKIEPITEEILNYIKEQKEKSELVSRVNHLLDKTRPRNLTIEQLRELNKVLESFNLLGKEE